MFPFKLNSVVINVDTKNKQLFEDVLLCVLESVIFLRSPLKAHYFEVSFRGFFSFPKADYNGGTMNIQALKNFSASNDIEHGEKFTVKFLFEAERVSEEWAFNFISAEIDEKSTANNLKEVLMEVGNAVLSDFDKEVKGKLRVEVPPPKTIVDRVKNILPSIKFKK